MQNWSKLFYFGNDADHNLLFTLCENGSHQMSAGVNRQNYGGTQHVGEYGAKIPEWTEDREYYLSVVIDGNTSLASTVYTDEKLATMLEKWCGLTGQTPAHRLVNKADEEETDKSLSTDQEQNQEIISYGKQRHR